jgi:enhancing lycopene biosynthesis protein 2
MKIGVLLSGCGVYDGSEIHEAVLTLLSIAEHGAEAVCMAPDMPQHHVVNHITGEEMPESRNVLVEAARIARGNIRNLQTVSAQDIDALLIPGGFGAAKNLTTWAFNGPDGDIHPEVQRIIRSMVEAGKPIGAMCMGPTVVARALKGSDVQASLSVGTTAEPSPYDIAAISGGMAAAGAQPTMRTVRETETDNQHRIVSAPCYMMEAGITQVRENIRQCVNEVMALLKG